MLLVIDRSSGCPEGRMISPETIALIKERTDLVALVGEKVRLTQQGRSFVGLCPFHKEESPSFHVNPKHGIFHCFGCKESGGPVEFVMKVEGRTFPEAIRVLAERAGFEANDAEELDQTVDITRRSGPILLVCPCGGKVRLDGWAVPGDGVWYLCERCGTVRTSLDGLARKAAA